MGDYNKQPGSASVFDMAQNFGLFPKLPDALFADGELWHNAVTHRQSFPALTIAPNIKDLQDKIETLQKRVDELEREKLFRQLQDENICISQILQDLKLTPRIDIILVSTQAEKFKLLPITFSVDLAKEE